VYRKIYILRFVFDNYLIKIEIYKIGDGENRMSEDLKEEMKKLREEIAKLKEQLGDVTEKEQRRSHGIYIDVGNRVHDYVEDIMGSVAEGIHGELEKSIFIGPRGVRIIKGTVAHREEDEGEVNFPKAAEVMSALGQEHRLKILNELVGGGKYINELQEKLSEITTSTLSSHLKVLEEAGLVVQEKVRGRYLITIPGRTAYKMATRITRFLERGNQE
jgi:DNA-binding HxlR family transcriptional regulator